MSSTVRQQPARCGNCDAKLAVPAEGLIMTCPYCGTETPVPDAAARRKRQREEQRRQREEEQRRQQRQQEEDQQQRKEQRQERAARSGRRRINITVSVFLTLLVAGIGYPLYRAGVFHKAYQHLAGEPGASHYQVAARRLSGKGFKAQATPRVERAWDQAKLYLQLTPGKHHALVLGSGQPIRRVVLRDPRGRRKETYKTLGFEVVLRHLPTREGVYTATVDLDQPGRFTWALHQGPVATKKPGLLKRLRGRRNKRKSRRSRRVRRRPSREPAAAPQRNPAPRPAGDPEDEALRKAFKEGELNPDEL